jgi:hypothetical protein
MRLMGKNKQYVVGILDDSAAIPNPEAAQKFKEITEFFTRFKYFGPILYGKTVNEILDKALEYDIEFCIIQCIGHIIKDVYFFELIDSWIENHTFFITGHIMDKENPNSAYKEGSGYYGLHKQCLLVNLQYYKKFDKPVFGLKDSEEHEVTRAKRHVIDIHDDYTPILLKPTEETQVCTPRVDGWNFINTSLSNGLIVYNFHPKIREYKQYVYPNKSAEELNSQLSWINHIVSYAPTCVFFWNTEGYKDLKYVDIDKPIDTLYTLAAGFKPNNLLHKYEFHENTHIVFYDYSKQALAFKNLLIQQWDGRDYPEFLRQAKNKFYINETAGTRTENETYEYLWDKELERWGGEDSFAQHWNKYKKLNHEFIHCDICEDPSKIINKISGQGIEVIWWSNAFHTVNAHYLRGLQGVEKCYNDWVEGIYKKNPNIYIFGKDYLDRPVEGGTIKEYLNE